MGLHKEETYVTSDPTPDAIAKAESARRTLVWAVPFMYYILIGKRMANGALVDAL